MSDTPAPSVGQAAPDFRASASTGPVALEDFRGRRLILYFYPKADTGG